jgi:hypothetical protein
MLTFPSNAGPPAGIWLALYVHGFSTGRANRPRAGRTGNRVLDPIERSQEVLFGLIMVLTFTGTISVATAGHGEIKDVLFGALGCNFAWGLVDAATHLMTTWAERARAHAHRLLDEVLPAPLLALFTSAEIAILDRRLKDLNVPLASPRLNGQDLLKAAGIFLLVFASTFPVVIPFLVMHDPSAAVRVAHAIVIAMLFAVGWSLGKYAGTSPWRIGVLMAVIGVTLAAITVAFGG